MNLINEQTGNYHLADLKLVLDAVNPSNTLLNSLPVWLSSQTRKSGGRGRSADNTRQYGVQKLRELILELAVRGKLVPQDPNDEPAKFLLEKIANEKARLVKEGKITKQKPLPEITSDEHPFVLPSGWQFHRMGNLTLRIGSGSTPRGGKSAYVDSGIPFLRSQNVWNHGLELADVVYISAETNDKMSNTVVNPGDVLLNITGASLGRSAIFPDNIGQANVSQHVTIIRPVFSSSKEFIHLFIQSPLCQTFVWGRQVGMAREGLSKKVLELFEVPTPPLAEQHRIVKKVDELMALCEQLEQQQTDAVKAHDTLVKVLLDTLTQSETAEDFQQNWRRIAEHFDTLFTTESSIDQLQQTLLQLAVMGKLVPQDPNDEPASVLLKKIADEKKRLVKEGKIKNQMPLSKVTESEILFPIPSKWSWSRLSEYSADVHYGYTASADHNDARVRLLRITDIQENKVNWETVPGCQIEEKATQSYKLNNGDILIARTGGTIGKSYLVENLNVTSVFASYLIRIRKINHAYPEFIKLFLGSKSYWDQLYASSMGTGQPNVNGNSLKRLVFPLPPLAEQHRIVKKVDELLSLCDQLKDRLNQAQTLQRQLADTVCEL